MGPIDYVNQVKNPMQSVLGGLQTGGALNQQAAQRQTAERSAEYQQAMQKDMQAVLAKGSPTASDYAALTVKYPQFNEQFGQAWNMISEEQKAGRVQSMSNVYAALESGSQGVAESLLEEEALAAENSGNASQAKAARVMAELVKANPDSAKTSVGLRLASMMGPEKFTETFTKLEGERRQKALDPSQLTAAQAKAQKAAVDANFAESQAAADLQKKGWDITKIQNDIALGKENQKIAALNAQISRTTNQAKLEELELKREEMNLKRDEKARKIASDVSSARASYDNMLNTIDRALATPAGVIESAAGPVSSRLPTMSTDVANFEALIETIDAQSFVTQIEKAPPGSLSEAEGRKLAAALQNLSLKQGAGRINENLIEAQRLLQKARTNLSTKYGVPDTIPDTPAAQPTENELETFRQKYLGGGRSAANP